MNVGLRGSHSGLFGSQVASSVVDLLLGNTFGFDEILVAVRGDVGKIRVGFGSFQVGFGLRKLLVHFGCINVGKKFASAHAGADIAIPFFEIPVGAGVDWRFDVGLHGTWKN